MAARAIPCRVCGKMFVPCNKPSAVIGAFNYHSLACSPECGAEYLRRVQAARQESVANKAPDAIVSTDESKAEDETVKETPKRTRGKRREANIIEDAMNIDKQTVEDVLKTEN